MKLPDFTDDSLLNALREEMGAVRREFVASVAADTLTPGEIEILSREGLDIPLSDVQVLADGTLAYKGRRVVLYIRDIKQYRQASDDNALSLFNVADCDKLREMKENNRYQRYVVATRDTGKFHINLMPPGSRQFTKMDAELRVCQRCLSRLNWRNFAMERRSTQGRRDAVDNFKLFDFFQEYGRSFVNQEPQHTDLTAPINNYTSDFKVIADKKKRERGFKCEECKLVLVQYQHFLQAHHSNGLQHDNSDGNIIILCIECHSQQYNHGHMHGLDLLREFRSLRRRGVF